MAPRNDLIAVSFLATLLVIVPLPWHWRARNIATLSMIGWLFLGNLIRGIDAILWRGNVEVKELIWCDITTKYIIGLTMAMPASALCICRHLANVASTNRAGTSDSAKRRRKIFEFVMCLGVPALIMVLHCIVQGHRFDIQENMGCEPATYWSWPAIVIIYVPPLLASAVTLVYATIALRFFIIRRLEFEAVLRGGSSSLTTGRYLRLMGLSVVLMCWGTSLGSYIIYLNAADLPLQEYTNWDDVHFDFGRVDVYPDILVPKFYQDRRLLSWWVVPASAFLFFLFFGFGEEAMAEYRRSILWFRQRVLRQTVTDRSAFGSFGSLPPIRGVGSHVAVKLPTLDTSSIGAYEPKWDSIPAEYSGCDSPSKASTGADSMISPYTRSKPVDLESGSPQDDLEASSSRGHEGFSYGQGVQITIEKEVA